MLTFNTPLKLLSPFSKSCRIAKKLALAFSLAIMAALSFTGCSSNNNTDTSKASPTQKKTSQDPWVMPEDEEAAKYFTDCVASYNLITSLHGKLELNDTPFTPDQVVSSMERLEIVLDKILGNASLIRNVHPDQNVRQAADRCQQNFVDFISKITLSKNIYLRLANLDINKLSEAIDRQYIQDLIKDYKRSGVNLDQQSQDTIRSLNNEINELGQKFGQNIREDVRYIEVTEKQLAGLPEDYIASKLDEAKNNNGIIRLSTNYPDYIPFSQYAHNDAKRKEFYTVFRQRGYPANESILKSILQKRHELALTMGYQNYAEFSMEELMIETPENASNFINQVSKLANKASSEDVAILLRRLQQTQPKATYVEDWQKSYLENLIKKESFNVDSQEIRQYFSYGKVKQGIFDLTETLFNVEIKRSHSNDTIWHPSVEAYQIYDNGKSIGKFFLDMHPRDGKYKHAAAFTLQNGIKDKQNPILSLVCNFPGENDPSALMEHSQVETFLHEFGHLLHGIFGGHQKRIYYSGIKTEHDFVEAPSQMLEEWVWDADTLKTFASNAAGETIPDELINKMKNARDFGRGYWTKHQMFYASISLDYYNQAPDQLNMIQTMKNNQNIYSPFPYVKDTYFHNSFGHLFGYKSNYYTYMWSLVIANDMFSEFKKLGLRNPAVAKRYRDKVLAPGGSKNAAQLVEDFLGRPYSFDAFKNSLSQ